MTTLEEQQISRSRDFLCFAIKCVEVVRDHGFCSRYGDELNQITASLDRMRDELGVPDRSWKPSKPGPSNESCEFLFYAIGCVETVRDHGCCEQYRDELNRITASLDRMKNEFDPPDGPPKDAAIR